MFGASIYFPPLFKAVVLGFFIWLIVHRQLRDWMYAGDIWHPLLMDLSLFALGRLPGAGSPDSLVMLIS